MIKVVFHVHSETSIDSSSSLKKIAQEASKNNIDVVCLTDHDQFTSSTELEKIQKIRIIAGEEIFTNQGEIIGLFLKEKIKPGLSPEETIQEIKKQSGLVIIPHPFDRFRASTIKEEALMKIINQVDAIEVFNSRTIQDKYNKEALEFSKKYNKLKIVGSDAHTVSEIKNAYFKMEDFSGPEDFFKKLKLAKFFTKKSSIWGRFCSTTNRIFKKI